jgi:MoaA/NifB/PqqE/SkfB family radical SAM enzyme
MVVGNGMPPNENNYLQLHESGVNQFSISLDFGGEGQDEFRGHSGLYKHWQQTLPRLAKSGLRHVLLNTAITKANVREILPLAREAIEWSVNISYSAYTALRTRDEDYCVKTRDNIGILRHTINELAALRKRDNHIANPEAILMNALKFLEQGYLSDCKAGIRRVTVMLGGSLVPCSMHRSKYDAQREMVEEFSRTNQCNSCYCGLRSYSSLLLLNHVRSIPYYRKRLFGWDI